MDEKKGKTDNSENSENSEIRFGVRRRNSETLGGRIRTCASIVGNGDMLASITGIPRRTLETYLNDEAEPKIGRVALIAKAAGVTIAWLATGEGPMRPTEGGQEKMADQPQTLVPQGVAVDMEMDSGGENGAVAALLDNRELVAILQLVAALSPDERREIYQVAAEKKRLTDLEDQVADLRSRLKSDTQ